MIPVPGGVIEEMSERRGRCRIGCSGWQYDHWKEVFCPGDLPKGKWFSYYAERFETVEVNNTFYHLPDEGAFAKWHDAVSQLFQAARSRMKLSMADWNRWRSLSSGEGRVEGGASTMLRAGRMSRGQVRW